jgi:hypothetical protein
MLRLTTAREDLNDDHAAAAERAGFRPHMRLIRVAGRRCGPEARITNGEKNSRLARRQLIELHSHNVNRGPFEFRRLQIRVYARDLDNRQIELVGFVLGLSAHFRLSSRCGVRSNVMLIHCGARR